MLLPRYRPPFRPWQILIALFCIQLSWITYWGITNQTLVKGGEEAFLSWDWKNYRDFGLHFKAVCLTGSFPRGERLDPSPPSPPVFNHIGAFWWPPLLPAWLALVHTLGVPSEALPWTVALWTATTAPLMFLLLRMKFGLKASFLTALVTALYPGFLLRSFQMSECFSLPLLLLFFRSFLSNARPLRTGWLGGLCTLARFPNGVLALLLIPGLFRKESRRSAVLSLGVMALVLLPWMTRNKILLDRFTLSVNGPYLLYASNHPVIWDRPPGLTAYGSEGRGTFLSFPIVFSPQCFPDKKDLLGPDANPRNPEDILEILAVKPVTELTDLFQRQFIEALSARPWDGLAEIPWKFRRLMHWHLQNLPDEPFWFIPLAWILQGAIWGLIVAPSPWRRHLFLFMLTQVAVAALFYGNDRFRTGLDLALLVALGSILNRIEARKG
ncbi:MAG: hypothetical protein AB7F75_08115 [Planctomycetota bacterium]